MARNWRSAKFAFLCFCALRLGEVLNGSARRAHRRFGARERRRVPSRTALPRLQWPSGRMVAPETTPYARDATTTGAEEHRGRPRIGGRVPGDARTRTP